MRTSHTRRSVSASLRRSGRCRIVLKELFHATGQLVRFILRRDRVRIPTWIAAVVLTTLTVAIALPGLYPTEQERQILAETMRNPAVTSMLGPAYGIDNYTIGAM